MGVVQRSTIRFVRYLKGRIHKSQTLFPPTLNAAGGEEGIDVGGLGLAADTGARAVAVKGAIKCACALKT